MVRPDPGAERTRSLARAAAIAAVAVAVFVLGYADGGYSVVARSSLGLELWLGVGAVVCAGLVRRPAFSSSGWVAVGLLVLFAALNVASVGWSTNTELAYDEFSRVVVLIGVVVAVRVVPLDRAAWADALTLGVAAIGACALASRLLPGLVSGGTPERFPGGGVTPLLYPVGYWTALGVLMAIGLLLLLRAAVENRSLPSRAVGLAPAPILAASLYLTSSRLAVIVLVLGWIVQFALSGRRPALCGATLVGGACALLAIVALRRSPELANGPLGTAAARHDGLRVAIVTVLCGLLAAALFALLVRLVPPLPRLRARVAWLLAIVCAALVVVVVAAAHPVARFNTFRADPTGLTHGSVEAHFLSGSSSGRWQFWSAAVAEFRHYPLLGHGAGSFAAWWAAHGTDALFALDAHSLFLEQLAELGIVGFLLIVGVFVAGLVSAAQSWRRAAPERESTAALIAVFCAYTAAAAVDWMWEATIVTVVGFAALATLLGPASGSRRGAPASVRIRLLVLAAALACAIGETIPFLRAEAIRVSQRDARAGRLAAARRGALEAAAVEPWASSPRLQLALVAEQTGDPALAEAWLGTAVARAHDDWQLWLIRARLETKLGEIGRAEQSLVVARRLNPHSELFQELEGPSGTVRK